MSDSEFQKYHDARIIAPYDPDESQYATPSAIMLGANSKANKWKLSTSVDCVRALLEMLARHPEAKEKDGLAFVCGAMLPGPRAKGSVERMHAMGFDLDRGTSPELIDRAMMKLGRAALRYTSFSNGKTRSEFSRDAVAKFLKCSKADIDTPAMRRYVREKEKWVEEIISTVELVEIKHVTSGFKCSIQHAPLHKNRVVIPLAAPFVIDDYENLPAADAEWKAKYFGVAESMGLREYIDPTGADLNRLFYAPRHRKGAPHDTAIAGGPLLDLRDVECGDKRTKAADEIAGASKSAKSVTPEGGNLGKWSRKYATGFQIADLIERECSDKIRGPASSGHTIECPFDDGHSNPGDEGDMACYCANASDGKSKVFTIKCQHASCAAYTNLDMLGKMLADNWFAESVLTSDDYNPIVSSGDASTESHAKTESNDNAKGTYQEAIEGLTPDSAPDAIEKVAKIVIAASLPPVPLERAISAMAKALDVKPTTIKTTLKATRLALQEREIVVGATTDTSGRVTFAYKGEFNFDEATDVCSKALLAKNGRNKVPTFSQINGNAVRLDIRDGRAEFEEMTQTSLWSELNNLVTFVRCSDSADGARQPVDRYVATHVYEQAYNTMPPAPEVLYTPLYLKGGNLLVTGKYHFDPTQGLNYYLILNDLQVPPVPQPPTRDDMDESLNWIRTELLADFPFRDTDLGGEERREPAEANALAMLITPFMRRMIQGRTPLFFVTKPQAGTGGTLLASLPMKLFDGVTGDDASMSYTPNEEEMEKRLVAAIMGTRTHLFFDDVKEFNNRVLLRALTSPRVGGRVLGHSRNFERENNYNWVASGNNPNIGEEMRRRTCWIRLNAHKADVAGREFRHPDKSGMQFNEFVERNRGLAIRHILTLVEFWQEQGAEEFRGRRLSGFDDWSKKVGGVLAACGVEGFLNTRAPAALDMEQSSENEFLRLWLAKYRTNFYGIADLYNWARDAELSVLRGRDEEAKRSNFERTLRGLEGRVFEVDGKTYAICAAQDANKVTTFGIEHVAKDA